MTAWNICERFTISALLGAVMEVEIPAMLEAQMGEEEVVLAVLAVVVVVVAAGGEGGLLELMAEEMSTGALGGGSHKWLLRSLIL